MREKKESSKIAYPNAEPMKSFITSSSEKSKENQPQAKPNPS